MLGNCYLQFLAIGLFVVAAFEMQLNFLPLPFVCSETIFIKLIQVKTKLSFFLFDNYNPSLQNSGGSIQDSLICFVFLCTPQVQTIGVLVRNNRA